MIFVDTSAFFALADRADKNYGNAKVFLSRLQKEGAELFTHSYIIVETAALLQRRLGMTPAIRFLGDMKAFSVVWVDEDLHRSAVGEFLKKTRVQ